MDGREKGLDTSEDYLQSESAPSSSRHVRSVGGSTGCVLRSEMFRMSGVLVVTFVPDEVSFNLSKREPGNEVRDVRANAKLLQTKPVLSLVLVFDVEHRWL